jgi:hypothetical protein
VILIDPISLTGNTAGTILRYMVNQDQDGAYTYSSLAHLRINIIRPALNTCLYNLRPDMIVRDNADAHLCLFDEGAKLGLVFNGHNLDCWAVVSYSSPLLCSCIVPGCNLSSASVFSFAASASSFALDLPAIAHFRFVGRCSAMCSAVSAPV